MEDTSTCSNTRLKTPIFDSDSLSETSSIVPITKKIKISRTDLLRDDAMIRDSESETDVDMQTNSANIISNISGLSSFLNFSEVTDNDGVSISDLNLIDPVRFDQLAENTPKKKKRGKRRRRACRALTSQDINSESPSLGEKSDAQDFSPSDGSDFDPESASRFSDDSMNEVKNHKRFWKKSLMERQGSKQDGDTSQNNDQMSEDNLIDFELNSTQNQPKKKSTVAKEQFNCAIDQDVPSPMIIIKDMYDEAEDDSEQSNSELENQEPEQQTAKEQKKKRKWVRKNACIFCENLVTNFTRHLMKHHKNESEVLQYMSINDPDPKVQKQRKRQITDDLRNRGNFLHNSKVIFEKEGELIPKKGVCPLSSPSTFTTCKNCLATFKRKYFYKHFKRCGSQLLETENLPDSYKKRVLANHSISIIPHLSAASQEVKNHILPRLRNDEISLLVKTDPLILAYGSRLMKKKKEARSRKAICSKLRDLGNLLLHLKTEDPSIRELSDLFRPQHYTTFINCVKKMCGFNEETGFVETISIPSRLRPSVLGCIEVLYTEMIMGTGSQAYKESLKKQLDEFKMLIEINWEWEISSNAEKTRKRNLMTKETVMPLDDDIRKITEKIHELEKSYSKELKKDVTVLNYEKLCEVTIAHIIVMDKKRAGDVAEAELCFYLNRKEEETPAKVLELLSQEQKEAIEQLDVFMIPGKRTRSVPVLLTKQMRRNIDIIVASRKLVGVAESNPLLFGRPLTSRPFDGGKCLNRIKSMCKLSNPKMLTSTGVRHHIATMSQLHAKKNDQYTEHLAGFLGHDLAVHSSNYRLPLQVIQKAVIGSSVMEFERRKKCETVTLKSLDKDMEKRLDGSKELQDNCLIKQTQQDEAIDVIDDITLKETCQSQDKQFLLENEETEKMLDNYQAGEDIQEKNDFEETDGIINQAEHPSDLLVEDEACEMRAKENLNTAQDFSELHELNEKYQTNGIIIQEDHSSNIENEKNETMLDNYQAGEDIQEKNDLEETDGIINQAEHPSDLLVEDDPCQMRAKENPNTAQDFRELHELNVKYQAKGFGRNVKGQFQGRPYNKQETCSKKIPLRNAEINSEEEEQMPTIKKLYRLKSLKSSSESSDEKEIDPKIEGPKEQTNTTKELKRKRKAQYLSDESVSSAHESQNVIETRRRKKTHTRWTNEELKAVKTYFKDNIKKRTNPGKAKCLEVLQKVPVLSRRTWMQLNTQVNNIYKKKI